MIQRKGRGSMKSSEEAVCCYSLVSNWPQSLELLLEARQDRPGFIHLMTDQESEQPVSRRIILP